MNYQNYDEYMRNLIGYPNMRTSTFPTMYPYSNMDLNSYYLERMYPEVYRVVYPMVRFACDNVSTSVTEPMLDVMTDDIYDRVEADGRINIDIYFEIRDSIENGEEVREDRQKRPRRRNRFLRDLIRILLLRELLGRRPGFPIRPF